MGPADDGKAAAVPKGGYGRRPKEDGEYVAFVRRAIRGLKRRAVRTDPELLPQVLELADELEGLAGEIARELHARGYSWSEIGRPVGLNRQHAWRRWHEDKGGTE